MEDKEFIEYISKMQRHKSTFCIRCGNVILPDNRRTISVTKNNIKVKKLCTLCEGCYSDMLDNLGIADVEW